MRLLIMGATGRLGRLLVDQALADGHDVTAFARDPAALDVAHPHLTVTRGDLTDVESVRAAVAGQDAVFAAVTPPARKATTLYYTGATNLVDAMRRHGVRRLVWVSSAGVDPVDAAAQGLFFDRVIKPLMFKHMYADAKRAEELLRTTDLDWTFVHPPLLTNGEQTGTYRLGVPHVPAGGKRISRADLAEFMLRVGTGNDYVRQTVAIAY
jgi:putative NADH-flavin reductase